MKLYAVTVYRSATYHIRATCAEEACDVAFGGTAEDPEMYRVDDATTSHDVRELLPEDAVSEAK